MKKWEPSRPALMAVIAILTLVTVLRGKKPAKGSGGEDTPYPYSWAEKRSGVLSVALSAPPTGYAWRVDMGADAETVTAEQGKPGAFTVKPLRENPTALTFTLANAADADDQLAELDFGVYVVSQEQKLKATHSGDRFAVLPGMLRGGDELGCPYKLWNENGRLMVFLTDETESPTGRPTSAIGTSRLWARSRVQTAAGASRSSPRDRARRLSTCSATRVRCDSAWR